MTKLDEVIKDIKEVNKTCDAWIYDADGTIKDNVICGSVLDLLYELKDYEVETTEKSIDWIVVNANHRWNTYNWNANIDHNIDVAEMKINGYTYMAIMVHRYGDVRGNYTDWAVCKFDYVESIFELESVMQYKDIIGKYVADINIFSEGYEVYDYINDKDIGTFYDIEVNDLLISIAELEGKN